MLEQNEAIRIRKWRGNFYIDLDPEFFYLKSIFKSKAFTRLLNSLENFLGIFEQLPIRMITLAAAAGIGIGLGATWIVVGQPDISHAEMISISAAKIVPERIYFQSKSFGVNENSAVSYFSSELVFVGENGIGSGKPVVVADIGRNLLPDDLKGLAIGDDISLRASNNGIYKYRLVEIRNIQSKDLGEVIQRDEEMLILYTSTNNLRTNIMVLIARPTI